MGEKSRNDGEFKSYVGVTLIITIESLYFHPVKLYLRCCESYQSQLLHMRRCLMERVKSYGVALIVSRIEWLVWWCQFCECGCLPYYRIMFISSITLVLCTVGSKSKLLELLRSNFDRSRFKSDFDGRYGSKYESIR